MVKRGEVFHFSLSPRAKVRVCVFPDWSTYPRSTAPPHERCAWSAAGRVRTEASTSDLKPIEDADTGRDQGAERAGKTRDSRFAEHIAEYWRLQHQTIDREFAVRRLVVAAKHPLRCERHAADKPPVALEERRHADHD